MTIDLKTLTPESVVPDDAIFLGANAQSAVAPSTFTLDALRQKIGATANPSQMDVPAASNGTQSITLPAGSEVTSVSVNGLAQPSSLYSFSGTTLILSSSAQVVAGDVVTVVYFE